MLALALLSGCSSPSSSEPSAKPSLAVASSAALSSPSATPAGCTIEGTPKDDELVGTGADDVICGRAGKDAIRGGGGDDLLQGGPGDDRLAAGAGEDELNGGPGRDTADYAGSPAAIQAALRTGTVTADGVDTLVDIERLVGSPAADGITGTSADDDIDGGGGSDRIRALAGNDSIRGGEGDDVMLGAQGVDTCLQGPGEGRTDCERTWLPVPFAKVAGLTLYEPAQDPLLIAYHQSLFKSAATMKPLGDKADWMIQPTRGRPTTPTSATDIPLPRRTPVVSPVDGKVIDVIEYSLYCEAMDTLVVIRPDDDPDVTVVVMHLDDVKIRRGDDVVAGGTLLGEPHVFIRGNNQVTAYVPGDPPHVHIEVESDGSKVVPGCDYKR